MRRAAQPAGAQATQQQQRSVSHHGRSAAAHRRGAAPRAAAAAAACSAGGDESAPPERDAERTRSGLCASVSRRGAAAEPAAAGECGARRAAPRPRAAHRGVWRGAAVAALAALLSQVPARAATAAPPPPAAAAATRWDDAAATHTARSAAAADAQSQHAPPPPRRRKMNSFVREAAERVGPSVVRLDVERGPDEPRPRPRLRLFADEPDAPPVRERGQGSGFVLDGRRGHVLTNAHVVAGARGVRCTFTDGRTFEATVLGFDEVTDLALLIINTGDSNNNANTTNPSNNLPEAPLGDSRSLDVGDWVVAVGNPFGLDSSVTLGIVSALRRSAAEVGIPDKRLDFIQTDAAINPGNSGGPLVNEFGEVVGISTAIRADAEGIGFAIPINTAKGVVAALAAGRPVQHPYLGIQMATQAAAGGVGGVRVVRVVPESPAAAAGLAPGDVVVSCGGAATRSARALQAAVEAAAVGEPLALSVLRAGGARLECVHVTPADVATRGGGGGGGGAGPSADAAPQASAAAAARAAPRGSGGGGASGYRQL